MQCDIIIYKNYIFVYLHIRKRKLQNIVEIICKNNNILLFQPNTIGECIFLTRLMNITL